MTTKTFLFICFVLTLNSCLEKTKEPTGPPLSHSDPKKPKTQKPNNSPLQADIASISTSNPEDEEREAGIPYELIVGNWRQDSTQTMDGTMRVWKPNEYFNDPISLNLKPDSTFGLSQSGYLMGPINYDGKTLELINGYEENPEVEMSMEVVSVDNSVLVLKHTYTKHAASKEEYWSYSSRF